VMQYYVPFII